MGMTTTPGRLAGPSGGGADAAAGREAARRPGFAPLDRLRAAIGIAREAAGRRPPDAARRPGAWRDEAEAAQAA